MPDDMEDNHIMESHKMEVRNAAASYRHKLLHGTRGGDKAGFIFPTFDLNVVHPSSPPFLGTSYWIPINDAEADAEEEEDEDEEDGCDADADDAVAAFLEVLSDTVGIVGNARDEVGDHSVRTGESTNTSNASSTTHTSCITASTRELDSPSPASQELSYLQSPLEYSPNLIIQNNICTISTPCNIPQLQQQQQQQQQTISHQHQHQHQQQSQLQAQLQQPSLAASSASTTTSCSSTSSTTVAKVETARRLFGDRDELLYNPDMSPNLDPIMISRGDDSDQEDDYYNNNMLNITTSMDDIHTYSVPLSPGSNNTTSQTHPPTPDTKAMRSSPCTPTSQHSPRSDGGSIILRNGVLLKRPPPSPNPTPVTISPTSTTASTSNTERQRHHISSNNTAYTNNSTDASLDSTGLHSDTIDIPDGVFRREDDDITKHVNTLPSFRAGFPIRLRVTESYAGYSSGNIDDHNLKNDGTNTTNSTDSTTSNDHNNNNNDSLNASGMSLLSNEEEQHFFSYDPYFSTGQYLIEQTETGDGYGNELRVTMGEQYMTLQDGDGTVWAVTRSRHSICPSTVIYSPKERYPGQIPSSHRPTSQQRGGDYNGSYYGGHDDGEGVELYPWALVKKEGQRMDHDVAIHLVAEPSGDGGVSWGNRQSLIGGLFDSRVSFRSRHGFDDNEAHSYTTMYRVETEEGEGPGGIAEGKNDDEIQEREIQCCIIVRDSINRDVVDVTIAPGIDPLLIICYLAVHAKMDVEPKLCEQ